MVRNIKVAAAVAAVLASGSALATQPTPASAAAPAVALFIAGSSAAKNAVLGALETNVCGGSFSLFSSSGDTNFFAVSCTPAASTGLPSANGSNIFTIWYRDEGGSVTGALPLVTGATINQLSLAGATGSAGAYTVAVAGSSGTNGIDDSFASGDVQTTGAIRHHRCRTGRADPRQLSVGLQVVGLRQSDRRDGSATSPQRPCSTRCSAFS